MSSPGAAEQDVVAVAADQLVVAFPARQPIVAAVAVERVVTDIPLQPVVAGAAVEHDVHALVQRVEEQLRAVRLGDQERAVGERDRGGPGEGGRASKLKSAVSKIFDMVAPRSVLRRISSAKELPSSWNRKFRRRSAAGSRSGRRSAGPRAGARRCS
jgi:hypothetical protein